MNRIMTAAEARVLVNTLLRNVDDRIVAIQESFEDALAKWALYRVHTTWLYRLLFDNRPKPVIGFSNVSISNWASYDFSFAHALDDAKHQKRNLERLHNRLRNISDNDLVILDEGEFTVEECDDLKGC